MRLLNGTESYTIQRALEVAAKHFADCEQQMREAAKDAGLLDKPDSGFMRMAKQFEHQRQECDRLADAVGEHDAVALHNYSDRLAENFGKFSRS